jgi:hypothetical protein
MIMKSQTSRHWGDRAVLWGLLVLTALFVLAANVFASDVTLLPYNFEVSATTAGQEGVKELQRTIAPENYSSRP